MRYPTDATQAKFARVMAWVLQQREFPTPAQVAGEFTLRPSTATRWLWHIADAIGVVPPWSRA